MDIFFATRNKERIYAIIKNTSYKTTHINIKDKYIGKMEKIMKQLYNKNRKIVENRSISKEKILSTLNDKVIKQTLDCIKRRSKSSATISRRPSHSTGSRDHDNFPIRDLPRKRVLDDERLQPRHLFRKTGSDKIKRRGKRELQDRHVARNDRQENNDGYEDRQFDSRQYEGGRSKKSSRRGESSNTMYHGGEDTDDEMYDDTADPNRMAKSMDRPDFLNGPKPGTIDFTSARARPAHDNFLSGKSSKYDVEPANTFYHGGDDTDDDMYNDEGGNPEALAKGLSREDFNTGPKPATPDFTSVNARPEKENMFNKRRNNGRHTSSVNMSGPRDQKGIKRRGMSGDADEESEFYKNDEFADREKDIARREKELERKLRNTSRQKKSADTDELLHREKELDEREDMLRDEIEKYTHDIDTRYEELRDKERELKRQIRIFEEKVINLRERERRFNKRADSYYDEQSSVDTNRSILKIRQHDDVSDSNQQRKHSKKKDISDTDEEQSEIRYSKKKEISDDESISKPRRKYNNKKNDSDVEEISDNYGIAKPRRNYNNEKEVSDTEEVPKHNKKNDKIEKPRRKYNKKKDVLDTEEVVKPRRKYSRKKEEVSPHEKTSEERSND